jgi:hypothetical protein
MNNVFIVEINEIFNVEIMVWSDIDMTFVAFSRLAKLTCYQFKAVWA